MRPASWSTGIPARNKGGTAAIPKTDGLWFACSGPFGSVDGHRELASAETLMVRGRPCPHQRRHGSTSRDGRAVVGVFQSVCLSDRSGRRPELRQCGQGCPRTKGSIVSVPLRGFRGLQERIAKSTRVVWLPYPSRFPHSSCSVVHVFSARHPGISPFPSFPHPVFATRQTPRKWPRVAKRFRTRFGRP